MRSYLAFILRFRWIVLALMLAVTVAGGYVLTFAYFSTTFEKLFFGNDPRYDDYKERVSEFVNDQIIVLGLPSPGTYDPAFIKRIEELEERYLQLDTVASVNSVLNAQRVSGEDGAISIEPYADLALDAPERAQALWDEMRQEDFYNEIVVSSDGQQVAIFLELTQEERKGEEAAAFVSEIYEVARGQGFSSEEIRLGGHQVHLAEVIYQARINIFRLLPITVLLLAVATFMIFRQLTPVFITGLSAGVAMVWAMAIAILIDPEVSIMLAMVPAIMVIVSFSDIIHLFSAYLLELSHGYDREEAIFRSGEDVGRACIYTSLTTFIGFIALAFVPTPVFQQLGVVLGFGVGVALLIAVTLCPILFSLLPAPRSIPVHDAESGSWDLLDRAIEAVAWLSTRYAKTVIVVTVLVIGFIAYAMQSFHIDQALVDNLHESNKVAQADRFFKDNFAGLNFLETFVETGEDGGVFDPEFLANTQTLIDRAMAEHPEIDEILSFLDLLRMMQGAVNPEAGATLPGSRELAYQYTLLFESGGGEELDQFVDFTRSALRLSVRLNDDKVGTAARITNSIDAMAAEIYAPEVEATTTGLVSLVGRWLKEMIKGQMNGLGFALTSIAFMMIISLRSLHVGLISMVPNLLPLASLCALLALTEPYVNSDTMIIMMIAIGIGVDDTIHFMTRLRFESARTASDEVAIRKTFRFAGRAIIQTTVILCIGFAPFAMSDYYSTQIAGTLLPFTLVVALVADLFLVPALVHTGLARYNTDSWL